MEPVQQSAPTRTDEQRAPARLRPWLTAWVAVLTEIVVFAALDNQLVVRSLRNHLSGAAVADYTRGAIDAATMFWWRFAPADGQATHVWAAQFAGIATLVVLTLLGTAIVARGVVGFWRVLVAVWALVAALAPVAIMVRNVVVVPPAPGPMQSRIGQAVYGYTDFGAVVVAGLVLGLLTGLVAAIVAYFARRRVEPVVPVDAYPAEREYLDAPLPPRYDTESTTQLPRYASPYGAPAAGAAPPPPYNPPPAAAPHGDRAWGEPAASDPRADSSYAEQTVAYGNRPYDEPPPAAPYVRDEPQRRGPEPGERAPAAPVPADQRVPDEQFETAALPPVHEETPARPVAGAHEEPAAARTEQYEPVRIDEDTPPESEAGEAGDAPAYERRRRNDREGGAGDEV